MILAQLSRGCRELPLFDRLWGSGQPSQPAALWYPCDSSLPQIQLCTTPNSSSGYPGGASSAPPTASAPAPSSPRPAGPSAASTTPPISATWTTSAPSPPLRRGFAPPPRREARRPPPRPGRHPPERYPQGVHRPEGVHLPAGALHATGGGHHRVRHAGDAEVEHDKHLRLPHPRGGRDGGAGVGVHPRRRLRVRALEPGARPGHRRVRAEAFVLLQLPQRLLRGGGEVPRRPPGRR